MCTLYPVIGGRRLICNSDWDSPYMPCALTLDTNVIKDIGSYYYGSQQIKPELKQVLQYIRLQYQLTRIDLGTLGICYRLGLTELSLRRNKKVNYSIFRNYGSAIVKLVTCDESEFARICDNKPSKQFAYNSDADELVDKCVAEEVDALPIYYGSILYLLNLQLENKSLKDNLEKSLDLFEKFYKWERDELGFLAVFPTLLGLYQLLGKDGNTKKTRYRGNARHLTKFDTNKVTRASELADLAWNSAWDMLFLMRLSDYNTGEVLRWIGEAPCSIPAALISRDYDPAWLSYATNPLGEILTGDGSTTLPLFESTDDFFDPFHRMDDSQRSYFWNRLKSIKTSSPNRNDDPLVRSARAMSVIHKLEDCLSIDRTIFPV